CMIFGRLSKYPDQQSCIDNENPHYLVFSYTKLVMAGLAMQPNPKSILIVGLGGGTLPMSFEKVYPNSKIDSVEVDSSVFNVAKQWFGYTESDNQKTHTIDGRVFVKRQLRNNKKYDLVILDAFNGDYIPEHLMTEEFLSEIKQSLSSEGLLIANTFSRNKLYHNESVTYQKVFGKFYYIHSQRSGNRIIYAKKNQTIYDGKLLKDTKILNQLISIGVDFNEFEKLLTNEPDWKENVRTLTDQYSPANLLNQ
ncbi:MAG: spermidine synthase, partial [Enterobacterales bacterium]